MVASSTTKREANIQSDSTPCHSASKSGGREAQELLLLCTTSGLSAGATEKIDRIMSCPLDWKYFLELASFQGVLPLVKYNLETGGFLSRVPSEYANPFKRAYDVTVFRNMLLSAELSKVVSAIQCEGIGTVCLKGAALAKTLYPNSYLRPVADMDLLVRFQDRNKAANIIKRLGYEPDPIPRKNIHTFHQEYCRKAAFPMFLELHWRLENERLFSIPEQVIWPRTQPLDLQGVVSRTLSPEDNLIFLANHFHKHIAQQLKLLCDISELLKKYEQSLDWNYILNTTSAWQMKPAVYTALEKANMLLGSPVPGGPLAMLRPAAWRCFLLELLCGREGFALTEKETKLRSETAALAHGLMMKGPGEMMAVLERYRGQHRRIIWLRTAFWLMVVFTWGLGHMVVLRRK